MSKAKGANQYEAAFLRNVEIRNYKSIKDLQISFKPGLNIIIGKNGSGKTNLLNCIDDFLKFNYDNQPDTDSKVEVVIKRETFRWSALSNNDYPDFDSQMGDFSHNFNLTINDKIFSNIDLSQFHSKLSESEYFLHSVLVSHGNPYTDFAFINKPLSLPVVNNGKISQEIFRGDSSNPSFVKTFFWNLFVFVVKTSQEQKESNLGFSITKQQILDFSEFNFLLLNDNLEHYSPIKKIRINPDFRIVDDGNGKVYFSNLYVEFAVVDQWLPFSLLSDGTKRLFYVISECSDHNVDINYKHDDNPNFTTLLIEEPELGIHPHQLDKLMQFLKEQSREKQIIITTHSPQVLDILNSYELDKIIICDYDKEKGTQLHHLNDAQIKKAKLYMKKTFLSDYWRFSDLEPA